MLDEPTVRSGAVTAKRLQSIMYTATDFPRRNWVIAIALRVLIEMAYSITIPSMRQFITTSSAIDTDNRTGSVGDSRLQSQLTVSPGFGKSEVFFTCAVVTYSIGELNGALLSPLLVRLLPYKWFFFLGTVVCTAGFLLYALAPSIWFVLIARYFIGLNCGILITALALYLSETSTYVHQMRLKQAEKTDSQTEDLRLEKTDKEKRNHLKENLFTVYIVAMSCSSIVAQGIASIASSIPALNPYRWAGWFMVILSTVLIVVHSLAFKPYNRESLLSNRQLCSSKKTTGNARWLMNKTTSLCTISTLSLLAIYTVALACSYTSASSYALLDTLLNPILSDHYGFRVQDESYALLGVAICQCSSGILHLIFRSFKVKTKNVLIFWMVLALVGVLLMADWQSIGHDPCREGFPESDNSTGILHNNETQYMEGSVCEQLSTDHYQCFWNPDSQVTGHYCPECFRVCRSGQKSLNFIQFSIGLVSHSLALTPFAATVTVLLSEVAPLKHQGLAFGVMNAVIGVARIVQPLWMDAVYESSGKHTHVAMAIAALQLAIVLAAYLALYKRLDPIPQEEEKEVVEEEVESESDLEVELAIVAPKSVRNGAKKYHLISQKSGEWMEE